MGLLVGTTLYPIISVSRRHRLITWAFRLAAIPVTVILFVLLIRNFYTSDPYAGQYVFYDVMKRAKNDFYTSLFGLPIFVLYTNST